MRNCSKLGGIKSLAGRVEPIGGQTSDLHLSSNLSKLNATSTAARWFLHRRYPEESHVPTQTQDSRLFRDVPQY